MKGQASSLKGLKPLKRKIWAISISKEWIEVRSAIRKPKVITTSVIVPVQKKVPYIDEGDPFGFVRVRTVSSKKKLSQVHAVTGTSIGAIHRSLAMHYGAPPVKLGTSVELNPEVFAKIKEYKRW